MRLYWQLIVILCFGYEFYAQNSNTKIEYGIPKIDQFKTKELGGETQNLDVIQDSKGVLIVANSFGFLSFDGAKWNSFKPTNDGVPISFAKDENERIYASGSEFIGYLKSDNIGAYTFHDLKNKLPKDIKLGFIWNTIYRNGKVFFQNDRNVLIFSDNKFTVLSDESMVNGLFSFEKNMYVSTSKGLYVLKENKLNLVLTYFSEKGIFVKGAFRETSEKIYFISQKKGLFSWDGKIVSVEKSNLSNFLKNNIFTTIKTLYDGSKAFGTSKGGVLITNKSLIPILRLTEKTGITSNNVRSIYQDYNQNLWLACQDGLTKINYPFSTTFYSYNEENFGTVEEITRFKNEIYLGTGRGTFKLNTIKSSDLFKDNSFPTLNILRKSSIYNFANIVINNKLIYGGQNNTYLFDGEKTSIINDKEARKFMDSKFHDNVLFMGHKYGCDILFYDKNVNIIKVNSIPNFSQQVRGVLEQDKNNIWLTTVSDGVYKLNFTNNFQNLKVIRFGLEDGLPSLRDNLVYNINNNDVLFTTHKGLFKFDKISQKFIPETRFGEKFEGGRDEFVYAFYFDENENAWIHSFRKREGFLAVKDSLGKYHKDEEILKGFVKTQAYEILSEPEKKVVWYGGSDGLTRLDYSNYKKEKRKDFNAVISKVIGSNDSLLVGGHQFNKSKKTELEAINRDVRFEVGATDFTNIKDIKFQYYLEGYDKKWSGWNKESFKIYTNLNQGNYVFNVRAKNLLEEVSKPDKYYFSVLPFWYQTPIFNFLFFALLLTFIIYVVNYFSKRKFVKKVHQLELVQKYEKEKNDAIVKEKERGLKALVEAQENERSRIARELHDGVVQQIGSVILKSRNILSKMNLLQAKESQELIKSLEDSNKDLRTISHQMMPRALKELGIVPALSDLLEGSFGYCNIEFSLEHFNISERLSPKIEVTIYRIVQELINNIIKHSKATHVSVQLFNANNTIILIVEDNGVGISSNKNKKGIGLLNITSRLDIVNGDVNFASSPKSGTLVTIKIPL